MNRSRIAGYTFFELLLSLTIMVLVVFFACSDFCAFIKKQTYQSQSYQLFHLLQFARQEAIKGNQNVTLCGSQDLKTCHPHAKGVIVFTQNEIIRVIHDLWGKHQGHVPAIKYSPQGHCLSRQTLFVGDKKIVIYDSGRARIE